MYRDIYIYRVVYIYIYIYIEREREKERYVIHREASGVKRGRREHKGSLRRCPTKRGGAVFS